MGDMKSRRRLVFDSIERCFRPSVALGLEGSRVYVHSYTVHSIHIQCTVHCPAALHCTALHCTVQSCSTALCISIERYQSR